MQPVTGFQVLSVHSILLLLIQIAPFANRLNYRRKPGLTSRSPVNTILNRPSIARDFR